MYFELHVGSDPLCHIPSPLRRQSGLPPGILTVVHPSNVKCFTGQAVGISIVGSFPMCHRETIWLDSQCLTRQSRVGILHLLKPGEWLVINLDSEGLSIYIYVENFESPYNGQALFLNSRVVSLSRQ